MTPGQVIELAKQAGFHSASLLHIYCGRVDALCDSEIKELEVIKRFAELVRADAISDAVTFCKDHGVSWITIEAMMEI